MTQTGTSTKAQASILKALIRSTVFKDFIRININAMHPDSGRKSVKTLMGEDPEVFFAISSSLPIVINNITGALTELAIQLKENYPPELLKSFMASLADDIDKAAVRECGMAWADLASEMLKASPELKSLIVQTFLIEAPKIKAGVINTFSRFVNSITLDDPQAFNIFVSKTFNKIDGQELGKAAATMTNALLDQKWHLVSWTWKLVLGRVRKRLGI
ncbi:MAG TPA: hypothetical protein ENN05_13230 [Deltaproteobacteria bacterium]|nr:hypothetical protein [Deltaproteobacteria bacterium]